MKKYKRRILVAVSLFVFFGIPTGFYYLAVYGNPYHDYLASKHVPKYLSDKGYSNEDIVRQVFISPKYPINRAVHHGHHEVVFKDEPDIRYYYAVKKSGRDVVQFCVKERMYMNGLSETIDEKTAHSEKQCLDSYANRD